MKTNLENFVNTYGIGISVEKLVSKTYFFLRGIRGSDDGICIINDRYLEIDGTRYQFIKSRKTFSWKVKVIA